MISPPTRRAMSTKTAHRMLDLLMGEFSSKSFSVCMMSAVKGFVHRNLDQGVSFHYVVPEYLCRKHIVGGKETDPQFSAAAIMALFDEVSTFSCAMKDRKKRPGVSVHLTTEIVKNVHAGEEVTILTSADKIGKTLGYCTMEILNAKGELVARGKHIKHLPMGLYFDVITHPLVSPAALTFYENFMVSKEGRKARAEGKHELKIPKGYPSIDGVGRVFDILGLKRLSSNPFQGDRDTSHRLTHCSNNGRLEPETELSFSMTVQQVTSNLNKTMHGGAVGCAVEHACLLSRSGNTNALGNQDGTQGVYDLDCYVQSLDVRYISPMRGDLIITTVNDIYAPLLYTDKHSASSLGAGASVGDKTALWTTRSIGRVLNKSDGSLCAEYTCNWALH